jgi:hypothetical protein
MTIKSATILLMTAAVSLAAASPASAAVVILAEKVDLSSGPFTFGVTTTDTFTLSFEPREQFDPSPVLVSTTGTAAVTSFFGAPSVSFTDPAVTFGPNSFPGFSSIPDPTRAPFSLTASDLGLRFSVGDDDFFGFARFAGSNLISVGFETSANTPILAGSMASAAAVPEPATWAMMLLGFGGMGVAMRRRRRSSGAMQQVA